MLSRREVLSATAGAAIGFAPQSKPKPFRIAHLTDIHVQPEKSAAEGFARCLEHTKSQNPDLILTGGDLVMDALGASPERAKAQWDLFTKGIESVKTPMLHTVGNHDVWGWNDRAKYEKESRFGKVWACETLGLTKPYYSAERGGWKIIVLDSTHRKEGNGYTAKLDDEQFEWLSGELANTKLPVLIVSHIPIVGACPMFDGDNEKSGDWVIPGAWMHIDARRIKDLFKKHPHVKLAISGHIHLIDEVLYNGVTYCCNGAVSAGWWGGDYQECTYGYAVVDLWPDGSYANRYVPFGWETKSS